jgi:hypothetical protein
VNLYVLVEGQKTEKRIYESWFTACLPGLRVVSRIEDLTGDSLFVVSGNGYPCYKERIHRSLQDVSRHGGIQAFIICVDAEEMTFEQKTAELSSVLAKGPSFQGTRLIVQDCCIETWLLAHRKMVSRNPQGDDLRRHLSHYDVTQHDPEMMPNMDGYLVRAHHHFAYLKTAFRERLQTYTKANPGCACDVQYLEELVRRHQSAGHIRSFGAFVGVLQELGACLFDDEKASGLTHN